MSLEGWMKRQQPNSLNKICTSPCEYSIKAMTNIEILFILHKYATFYIDDGLSEKVEMQAGLCLKYL